MRRRFVGPALLPGIGLEIAPGAPSLGAFAADDAPAATPDQLTALQTILARPEFQVAAQRSFLDALLDPIRSWLGWLFLELLRWLGWLFGSTDGGGGQAILLVIVGLACLLLIGVLLVVRQLMRGTLADDDALTDVNTSGPPRAVDELARARTLAQAGDARRAVHHLYRAVLLRLDERDHLPFDGTLTNRELLPRLTAGPALAGPFAELVARFDRLWYGQNDCSAEEYRAFAQLGDRVWQAAGTVTPTRPGRRGPTSPSVVLGASSGAR